MIRAAVIGAGSMGKNHARVYSEIANAQLVAVADSNLEIAESVTKSFGGKAYQDYTRMLDAEQPDAVSIALPTAMHYEAAISSLQAGAHILIEKPIANTLQAGQEIIDCASSQGRLLMVGHIVRFNPAIQALKQKLLAGELGRIFQIYARRIGPFPARIRDVGVVIDLATHDLDLMRFLTGLDPVRVYAETEQRINTEHEDLLLGLLRFPDHILGALEINWLTPIKVREVLVLGENGLMRVDDLTQDLYFYENAQASSVLWSNLQNIKGISEGSMIRFSIERDEPLKAELQAFIDAIENSTPSPVSGEDGLAALKLALEMIASAHLNQSVQVENVPRAVTPGD